MRVEMEDAIELIKKKKQQMRQYMSMMAYQFKKVKGALGRLSNGIICSLMSIKNMTGTILSDHGY